MKFKWTILSLSLLLGSGASYWVVSDRAQKLCRQSYFLATQAKVVSGWLKDASEDPFLDLPRTSGPTGQVFKEFNARAKEISSDIGARLLPELSRSRFLALSATKVDSTEFAVALSLLSQSTSELKCNLGPLISNEERILVSNVETGSLFWAQKRGIARIEKQSFEKDRKIYCRSEHLLLGLRHVLDVADNLCKRASQSKKKRNICKGGIKAISGNVEAEILDLEKQKEFNMKKLRQKWPPGVLRGLQC